MTIKLRVLAQGKLSRTDVILLLYNEQIAALVSKISFHL